MPRNNVVRLVDHPDMTIAVYHGPKATTIREIIKSKIISLKNGSRTMGVNLIFLL